MSTSPFIGRRRALTTLGTISLGTFVAACRGGSSSSSASSASSSVFDGAASCTLSPELTEGPYYFDVDSIRSDIREDRKGTTLRLALRVLDAVSCAPITDAVVDLWHCDAVGTYSGFESASEGGANTRDDSTYLRGAQATNGEGVAEFTTVYPGWYRGRTAHIHVKVHLDNATLLTSQLFFPETTNEAVYQEAPYSSDTGRNTSNDDDSIFEDQMVMTTSEEGDGYLAVMNINVQP